jgi:hypothetical protein
MKKLSLICFFLLAVCLELGGCSYVDTYITKPAVRSEFDKSVKDYNRMLRWKEMESAGMLYLNPELRDPFMETVQSIKKRGVTITEYRILATDYDVEKETAEVMVEFDYYILPSNRIKKLAYKQEWVYRIFSGDQKIWKLKSGLPAFE